jgi:glycosyltransferase involved in cell wall biosynthesis
MSTGRRPKVLVVASPSPIIGGGSLRALRSLEEYVRHFETYLFIPWRLYGNRELLRESAVYLRMLKSLGVRFAGFSLLPKVIHRLSREGGIAWLPELILPLIVPDVAHVNAGATNYNAVVSLHEDWDAVYAGYVLAKLHRAPNAVLLHNPPFYGSTKRSWNILKAVLLWRELRSSTLAENMLSKMEAVARNLSLNHLRRRRYEKVLRKYTLVLGVSKATAIEMGGEWLDRMVTLDPGVSLNDEDLEVIESVRRKVREKSNYVVFGGRLTADKGLAEALIAFKYISKHFPEMKLVITGRTTFSIRNVIGRICRRLNLGSKVILTGFIPREERFKIVANAKLVLYPSHVDAFSYTVLESLHLGTPVVAYRIPAMEIYYARCPGVELVEEGDLEAFTVRAIELLEKGVEAVEPPKIKSWKEIMSEEVELILKTLRL